MARGRGKIHWGLKEVDFVEVRGRIVWKLCASGILAWGVSATAGDVAKMVANDAYRRCGVCFSYGMRRIRGSCTVGPKPPHPGLYSRKAGWPSRNCCRYIRDRKVSRCATMLEVVRDLL